jgi:hypothetical protein
MRHRTFIGPTFYTAGKSLNENREVIRAQAQAFVNAVGVDNVVSVCEHAMTLGPFSVVVWYRSATEEESAVVQVNNATIAQALKATSAQPAGQAASGSSSGWLVWLLALLAALAALVALLRE